MSRILAVETPAEACSVAILDDSGLLEFFEHAPMKHAELLLPAVQSLLVQAGFPPRSAKPTRSNGRDQSRRRRPAPTVPPAQQTHVTDAFFPRRPPCPR